MPKGPTGTPAGGKMRNLTPQMQGDVGTVKNVAATLFALDTDGPNPTDMVTSEIIQTSGYFTGDVGIVTGSTDADGSIHSASLSSTNTKYYQQVADKVDTDSTAVAQLSVAYGHVAGEGSAEPYSGKGSDGPSQAVYNSWASMLLAETHYTGGFTISSPASDSAIASGRDEDIYVISAHRSLMSNGIDPKNWTIKFTGSPSNGTGTSSISLTDDSDTTAAVITLAGPRYNIVSGSAGTVVSASTAKTYGWFYPDMGVWIFSGAELSASIPGKGVTSAGVVYDSGSQLGFGTFGSTDTDENNALRVINCLRNNADSGGEPLSNTTPADVTPFPGILAESSAPLNIQTPISG
jgi:hypothetical protein